MLAGLYTNTLQHLFICLEDATKNYVGSALDRKTWEKVTLSICDRLQDWSHKVGETLDIKVKTDDTMLIETADSLIGILVTVRHQKVRINVIQNEY